MDLLLLKEGGKSHYCWIKNFNKLVSSQVSKDGHKRFFCKRCLNPFTSKEKLTIHKESREQFEYVKSEMPKEGSKCKFTNMNRTTEVPFRIYANFESILKPIETIEQNDKESDTEKYQTHIPCGYCFHTVSSLEGKEFSPIQDRAESEEDSIPSDFTRRLIEHVREIHNNLEIKMIFTEKDKKKYDKAVTCWLFGDFFEMEKIKEK